MPVKQRLAFVGQATLLLGLAALAATLYCWNYESVFFRGAVFFVDGDCYARMTRVAMVMAHPLTPIRTHAFENFPFGTIPHTTAPLDYLIAALALLLRPWSSDSLSLAGAIVSPLLGLATFGVLAFWSRHLVYRWAVLLVFSVSPILAHGFALGRPDHQSLLLFLVALGLASETRLDGHRAWPYASAIAWGTALWVSLFEPLLLLGLVLAVRLVWTKEDQGSRWRAWLGNGRALALFVGILALALIWDGWRAAPFDSHFSAWARNIGELRHADAETIFHWVGWLIIPTPILLGWAWWKKPQHVVALFMVLILMLGSLTFYHMRWGYFLALAFALSLPLILPLLRWKVLAYCLLVLSLWPVAAEWERTIYPNEPTFLARAESLEDSITLRDAALALRDRPRGGVIAPWWFCPAIVWWSAQPCLGGSSHQSLPGIVDSSEFFLAPDFSAAAPLLVRRKVTYVVTYEPSRVAENAALVLSRTALDMPLVKKLHNAPSQSFPLQLIHANRSFKVFALPGPTP